MKLKFNQTIPKSKKNGPGKIGPKRLTWSVVATGFSTFLWDEGEPWLAVGPPEASIGGCYRQRCLGPSAELREGTERHRGGEDDEEVRT